ncbi:MAG: Adaptive-response sensory-kinase SasA [Elusimicrobia bacterium]|nr:Adaptive-response sensory-kinase SasA [Elusimicrobiota bacterium]
MTLTPFAISGLLAAVFSFGFGVFVFFKSSNRKLGKIWSLFSLSAANWGIGCFWIGTSQTPESALMAWRFAFGFGVAWMPALFFHFVCTFCDLKRPKTILLHYLFSIVTFAIMPTHYFFKSPQLKFGSLYFPQHEWPFNVFVFWWLAFIIYSHIELGIGYRTNTPVKKAQIKYFFLGTAIGYMGGSLVYLPHFDINLYPWGNFTVFIYPFIMSYAIVRFNLMDIRVFIRRTALIVGVYFILILLSAPILYVFHTSGQDSRSWVVQGIEILIISLILSTGPFLYAFLVKRNAYFQDYTLAGLTHELKSPLAIIESAVDFLNNNPDVRDNDPGKLSAYLEMIQRNSSRLQLFVNDLLAAFDPQVKDVHLLCEQTDMTDLIKKTAIHHKPLADSKNIQFHFDLLSEAVISCDRTKIGQVLSNVLSNAIKFSKERSVYLSLKKDSSGLTVSVRDEGSGLSQQELPHIFNRFYQGMRGQQAKGSGIGLTIAKLWVEAHGGKIWAESEGEGKGTTVTFTLPV